MKFTILFLFLFVTVSLAGGDVTMELVDSDITIVVDKSSKSYSPKILEIPFTYKADDYGHPGFNCYISSSLGSVESNWSSLEQKLLLPTFYAEPGTDSIITISFHVVIEDIWNTDMGGVPPLDEYTVEHTITVSTVKGTVIDDGLEWITTGDGLHKNDIWDIKRLKDSTLIFEYSLKSGMAIYKDGVQDHWDSSNVFDDKYLNRLQLFKDGLITYDSYDSAGYVRYYDGSSWHLTDFKDLPNNGEGFRGFAIDTLFGKAWVEYHHGGTSCYDGASWLHFNSSNGFPSMKQISFFEPDGIGGVWIRFNDHPRYSFAHYNGKEWSSHDFYANTGILYDESFYSDLQGGFYACNWYDSKIFHYKKNSLHDITADLISAPIKKRRLQIYPDGHGDIWLSVLNDDSTEVKFIHSSASSDFVRDTVEHDALTNIHDFIPVDTNRFWLKHYQSVSYYDGVTFQHFDISSGLVNDSIDRFEVYSDKAWVTYERRGGVSYFDGMQWHYFTGGNGFTDYRIERIFPLWDGEAWATFKDHLGVVKIPTSENTGILKKSTNRVESNPVKLLQNSYLLSLTEKQNVHISILNVNGQIIDSKELTLGSGEHHLNYPKGIAAGMYLLSVKIRNRSFISKMVHSL